MNPTDPAPRQSRADSLSAFSIMFFFAGLLFFSLSWADGVRHDRGYLHFPHTDGLAVASLLLFIIGVLFLVWARNSRAKPRDN